MQEEGSQWAEHSGLKVGKMDGYGWSGDDPVIWLEQLLGVSTKVVGIEPRDEVQE